MCGICGAFDPKTLDAEQRGRVHSMNGALVHRGPDADGVFEGDRAMIAMRRLSIIDLAGGNQPLYNEDQSLVLVANGEIYNYVELMAELEQRGHRFATHSDCETILHLYEELGPACVMRLRGMFAFALYDMKAKRLMIARDRMGEKPLVVWRDGDATFFASELKALRQAMPDEAVRLDPNAVDLYLHYRYLPEPVTLLQGVRKLPAAHYALIDERGQLTEHRYWNPEDAEPVEGDPARLVREELERISEIVIRSDVPVGIALSGGLDSGALAALAAPRYKDTFHAFSVGYPNRPDMDERAQAKALADRLGLPFHDVELSAESLADIFPELVYWMDDPIGDIAAYGYYAVMKLARERGVPVMLNGIGGDELFWGYPWVRTAAARSVEKARALPGADRPGLLRRLFGRNGNAAASPADRLVFYDLEEGFNRAGTLRSLLTPAFRARITGSDPYRWWTRERPWEHPTVSVCVALFDTWLRSNCIALGDRTSMASSVELRLPLVDYRLVELVLGLRKLRPDHELEPKAWLREAVKGVVPDELLARRKRGFTPPVTDWYRALVHEHRDKLQGGHLVKQGILDADAAARVVETDLTTAFYLLTLELWCEIFIDGRASRPVEQRVATAHA
jgi:asparagine synthase (glutamine-hydrolysing)